MSKTRTWRQSGIDALLPWAVPVGLVALWQLAAVLGWLSTRVAPAPLDVLKAGWALAATGELFQHLWASFARAAVGFLIGGGLGLLFGLLNGGFRLFEDSACSSSFSTPPSRWCATFPIWP